MLDAVKKMPVTLSEGDVEINGELMTIMGRPIGKPHVGNYVVVWDKPDSSKRHLGQVTRLTERKVYITHEKLCWLDGYRVDEGYPYHHMIANLGDVDEETNTLYAEPGIEPYIDTIETSMGKVHFFRAMSKREREWLLAAIEEVYAEVRDLHWDFFPIEIQVRNPKGKWAGSYATHKEVKDKPPRLDTMLLHPKEWDRNQLRYILFHELAHGIQNNLMKTSEAAKWLRAYHKSVTLSEIKKGELQEVLTDFLHAGEEYSPANDHHDAIFEEAISYIESYHMIAWKDIQILLQSSEGHNLLKEMWPEEAQITDQSILVSEYAKTNWKEFHADSFGYALSGITVPDNIKRAVEKDIDAMKKRHNKPPAPNPDIHGVKKKKKKSKDKTEKTGKKKKKGKKSKSK